MVVRSEAHDQFGAELRARRNRAKLSLESLGHRHPDPEKWVSKGYLGNLENGKGGTPSPDVLDLYLTYTPGDNAELEIMWHQLPRESDGEHRRADLGQTRHQAKWPQGYELLSRTKRLRIVARAWATMSVAAAVKIHRDGPLEMGLHFQYPPDPRVDIYTVRPIAGCILDRIEDAGNGILKVVFRLTTEDNDAVDTVHTHSFAIDINSTVPALPYTNYVHHTTVGPQQLELEFDELPAMVWWHRGLTNLEALEPPTDAGRLLVPAPLVAKNFVSIGHKIGYGLGWQWLSP